MTDMERDYLDAMRDGFYKKATEARTTMCHCSSEGELNRLDAFASCMEICAELIQQIIGDFKKFEAFTDQKKAINDTLSKAPKWNEGGNV